ncbi:Pal1 cell morphology protein-domain-containing protein [Mycena maculata]|uniref:Pal1 cell morphology protein-domain-containing protein n=1 Tax=Mycena maculata TaxID=230809 RepID=A0AAD7KE52_9AGAR|nr:Pal1 cell morphology protein-domain-containing protein [Mycena maculata]
MAAVHSTRRSEDNPFADEKASPLLPRSPPPPPKKHRQPTKPKDIVEEVRDTVVVRGSPTRMARSQTATTQNNPPRNAPQLGPRSLSQDSVPVDKKKSSKKGSKHADVIDRLDYTGVGPMFHHDGPFDACAPSRNRQKDRAPMRAWTARPEDPPKEYGDNPYPSPNAYSAFSASDYEPPKKKVDAIAEAWGIHEPEPYEEFFAGGGGGTTPASSIYNGKESSRKSTAERPRAQARRSQLPPPMPIFVPDGVIDGPAGTALPDSPGSPGSFPRRNKSLMHRIRKMRDSPNVPVGGGADDESAPETANGERPTHRSQNSFLGRFANGRTQTNTTNMSPTSENSESYVFIEPKTASKDLPPTPGSGRSTSPPENGYFEEPEAAPSNGGGGGGLGRKTSLMKKVGRVVRGTR